MTRVFLTSLGCRLNEAEAASWSRAFGKRGCGVITQPHEADLIVINTCAVTVEAARKSRKLVARLHRSNPAAPVILTGCFAELEAERARSLAGVHMVVGNADKEALVEQVLANPELQLVPASAGRVPVERGKTRAFLKVQDGCKNRCTFCVVTIARGNERSRPIAAVIDELQAIEALGHKEVVLTGVHLGGYGRDIGSNLEELVSAVLSRTSLPRVRLSSLEPWDLAPTISELFANPRLMPHLHLPLQSGAEGTLKRMARQCTASEYLRLTDTLRAEISQLEITTDVIVGFPGETDAEWAESLRFVEGIGFSHVHAFAYSRREGTVAARMPHQVPVHVIRQRSCELQQVAATMKQQALSARIGQVREVLWEEAGDTGRDGARQFGGYTDNYLRVRSTVGADVDLENRITSVMLQAVDETNASLVGQLVGGTHSTARPTSANVVADIS